MAKIPGKRQKRTEKKYDKAEAEKKYWKEETELFRIENRAAYRQSRGIARIARILASRHARWKKQRENAKQKWISLENMLLSGKKNPALLAKMLSKAYDSSLSSFKAEKDFLQRRADAYGRVFREIDWNAVDRVFSMQDYIAEIKAEANFYGHLKEAANKKILNRFAELVSRLNLSNDKAYKTLRLRVTLAGIGIENQEKLGQTAMKNASKQLEEGKIKELDWIRQERLIDLAITQQYVQLTRSAEYLFKHMKKNALQKELKAFLKEIEEEMRRRKYRYEEQQMQMERQIRKTKGL